MTVLLGVADAHALAILELDLPRSLDVQEEEVDGIVDPRDLEALERCGTAVDRAAVEVWHDAIALRDAAAQPAVLEVRINAREVDHEQVLRRRVERITITRARRAAAAQQRLVIAGDEPAVAVVGVDDAIDVERMLEERGDVAIRRIRGQRARVDAHGFPARLLLERDAAADECLQRCAEIAAPIGQLNPCGGNELAARLGCDQRYCRSRRRTDRLLDRGTGGLRGRRLRRRCRASRDGERRGDDRDRR